MYLTGISPPGNIKKEIYQLKQEIFRKTGDVSSVAFPPVIPVLITGGLPDYKSLQLLQRIPFRLAAGRISSCPEKRGDVLCLDTEVPAWDELTGRFADIFIGDNIIGKISFPELIYFLNENKSITEKSVIRTPCFYLGRTSGSEEIIRLSWKKGDYSCFLVTADCSGRWWENISFQEIIPGN